VAAAAGLAALFFAVGPGQRNGPTIELTQAEQATLGSRLDLLRDYRAVERLDLLEDLDVIGQLDRIPPGSES
jgi:hypothetical protein